MKSLEIINERINELKGNPELVYYDGHKINCLFHNGEGAGLLTYSQLEIIQQYLEVLEIIRKKEVDIPVLKKILARHKQRKKILEIYNLATSSKLTMEELLKLKQWLEENE